MPSIDNLELLESRVSKLENLVGQFDKLDQTKVKWFINTDKIKYRKLVPIN